MKYLRYLTLVGLLLLPLAYSQAQVRVGVGIGFGPGYVVAPVCPYGYYSYYPYACAPYGFYGPSWFANGVFIGAGPWYHGFGNHFVGRPFFGRPIPPRRFEGRAPFVGRGFEGRGRAEGFHGRGGSHGGRR
jgi:hypothetical protein